MAELHSSQISSITRVKDKETKMFILQNISRLKLRARTKQRELNNRTVNSDYVGICLHKQSVVYLKVNLIRVCFKLSHIRYHYMKENISVRKGALFIPR